MSMSLADNVEWETTFGGNDNTAAGIEADTAESYVVRTSADSGNKTRVGNSIAATAPLTVDMCPVFTLA